MSVSLNKCLLLPLRAFQLRGSWGAIFAMSLIVALGLARGPDSLIAQAYHQSSPFWIKAAFVIDALLLALNRKCEGCMPDSIIISSAVVLANFPFVFLAPIAIIDGLVSLYMPGFWRDLMAISISLLSLQFFVSLSQDLRRDIRTDISTTLRMKITDKAIGGAISTSSISFYSFSFFLIFHLAANIVFPIALVENIEEAASSAEEWLDHPAGLAHPGVHIWMLFASSYLIVSILRKPSWIEPLKGIKRWQSGAEIVLLAFLSLSLTTSRIERHGRQYESDLSRKAALRLKVAEEFYNSANLLTVQQRAMVISVMRKLGEKPEISKEVAEKTIHEIVNSNQENHSPISVFGDTYFPHDLRELMLIPASQSQASPLMEMRFKRKRIQSEADAATMSLEETLSGAGTGLMDNMFENNHQLTQLLISSVVDFLEESSKFYTEAVCVRVLRVFSNQESPRDFGKSDVFAVIDENEKAVTEEHIRALDESSRDSKRDPNAR